MSFPRFQHVLSLLASLALASSAGAQSATVTYDLNNVWMAPNLSSPWSTPQQLTGTFVWTYNIGDFENGSGVFTSLNIPYGGSGLGALGMTIETKSIEIVLQGSYHDKGVDISMKLTSAFTPTQGAVIDIAKSKFEVQNGTTIQGLFTSGTVDVSCTPSTAYGVGSPGTSGFVPVLASVGGMAHLGNTAFGAQGDSILGQANCFLLLGFGKAQQQAIGVDILVNLAGLMLIPAQASGTAGIAGSGSVLVPLPIPSSPVLVGLELDMQLIALDAGSPMGIASASNGLSATICL